MESLCLGRLRLLALTVIGPSAVGGSLSRFGFGGAALAVVRLLGALVRDDVVEVGRPAFPQVEEPGSGGGGASGNGAVDAEVICCAWRSR